MIVPLSDVGTYLSSNPFATGLMQPGLMMLLATPGEPGLSVKGARVRGLIGLVNVVPRAVKSPERCAFVGTMVWLDPASARSQRRWYEPNQNSLFRMMAPPALPPA